MFFESFFFLKYTSLSTSAFVPLDKDLQLPWLWQWTAFEDLLTILKGLVEEVIPVFLPIGKLILWAWQKKKFNSHLIHTLKKKKDPEDCETEISLWKKYPEQLNKLRVLLEY